MSLGINPQFRDRAMTLIGASGAWNSIRVHKTALNKIKAVESKYSVCLDMPWLKNTYIPKENLINQYLEVALALYPPAKK